MYGWDSYDNAMGGGLLGNLTEEEKRRLRMQSMGAMGAGLLDASGWSTTPQTLGQGMARGLGYGQQAYQQGAVNMSEYKDRQMERDSALAKAKQEEQAQAAFDRIVSEDREPTPKELHQLVAMKPSLTNVAQEYMRYIKEKNKGPDPYAQGPLMRTEGGRQFYNGGDGWRPVPALPNTGGGGNSGPKPTTKQQDYQFLIANDVALERVYGTGGKGKGKDGGGEDGGWNPRQKSGANVRNSAALDYASNLTGVPKDELEKMSPEEVANTIRTKGERLVQGRFGRFVSGIPIIGEGIVNTAASDLVPFSSEMAAGQVSVNNPAGDTGEKAFDLAARQVPGPTMDLEVQAQKIQKMLEESQRGTAPSEAEKPPITAEAAAAELARRRRAKGQ
jgi:hypothetical protein